MTFLVTSIFVDDQSELSERLEQARHAVQAGAHLIEWRIDRLAEQGGAAAAVSRLLAETAVPTILTCRPQWEGGHFEGDDGDRATLLAESVGGIIPKYLDLELRLMQERPQLWRRLIDAIAHANEEEGREIGLILSSHDFDKRPHDLLQRIETMTGESACNIIKVAWMARSLRDNLQAFELQRERNKPIIAVCMGQFGLMSRVLAPMFGGFLTFASASSDLESKTAPGQPSLDELKALYGFDSIGKKTNVYGVIGWPVDHSLSPKLHNAGFDAIGFDGVYLPLPIPPEYEHFEATLGALLDDPHLPFRGASVTLPHKAHLVRFVTERGGVMEPMAETIGAANTLTVQEDGTLEASNTDCPAAIKALCARMDIEFEQLAGKTVAMLGAGGVARGIVAGLAQLGAQVTIFNRTPQRAQELATAFKDLAPIAVGELDQLHGQSFDVYINGTSIGMAGGEAPDDSPLPADAPLEGTVVMETVYTPIETPLLRQAEAAGAMTLDGMTMFVRQAGAQFMHWTGRPLPVDVVEVGG